MSLFVPIPIPEKTRKSEEMREAVGRMKGFPRERFLGTCGERNDENSGKGGSRRKSRI